VLGKVLWATVGAGPTRDKLDPENAARDAGVHGGASLGTVLRVQARSAVPVKCAGNQSITVLSGEQLKRRQWPTRGPNPAFLV
jgi:hypothetical protein